MIFEKKGTAYKCTGYCELAEKDVIHGYLMTGHHGFYMFFPTNKSPLRCGDMNSITRQLSRLNHGVSNGADEKRGLHQTDVQAVQEIEARA